MTLPLRVEIPSISGPRLNVIAIVVLLAALGAGALMMSPPAGVPLVLMAVVGAVAMQSPRIAQQ